MSILGIKNIWSYIAEQKVENYKKNHVNVTKDFIEEKIGITHVAKKNEEEETSDLCVKAFQGLLNNQQLDPENIDCLCVCTQNGDHYNLPHTSAIIHQKLALDTRCITFDISLGCSGYVHSLHILRGFMLEQNLKTGLLFTCDPYSKIIDPNDKTTDLIFGDAAAVTLLSEDNPLYVLRKPVFQTASKNYRALIKNPNQTLSMNGREVFNYVIRNVPDLIKECLFLNQIDSEMVDYYLFHQGSKIIVERIQKILNLEKNKVPFDIKEYGNTVSSSIPILLRKFLFDESLNYLLLCGFGVGLSSAITILEKNKEINR